jgi:Tfp pilus assembly protein PilZ
MRLGRRGSHRGIEPPPDLLLQRVRVPLIERAALFHEDDVEEVLLIDVGLGGAFVERREPLGVGEPVEIHFRLPGNEIPVAAGCKVAWWRPSDATLGTRALPAGLGLAFTMLSDADRDRIRAYLILYCTRHPRLRRYYREASASVEEPSEPQP